MQILSPVSYISTCTYIQTIRSNPPDITGRLPIWCLGRHIPVIPANLPEKLAFAAPKQTFLGQNLVIIFNSPGEVHLLPVKILEISKFSELS